MPRLIKLALVLSLIGLVGCFSLPLSSNYSGPPPRPPELDQYYSRGNSFTSFREEPLADAKQFKIKRITIGTDVGDTLVDYYQQNESSDDLIFVFPVLGGRNIIADYFADYFARHGFDTAIVHRKDDFKDPKKLDQLEQIFRETAIRDRIVMDFFEKQYQKKDFGSFGVSRGGINVAMTAGIDPRLKYNVIALGGTSLVKMFEESNERRIRLYREKVQAERMWSKQEFIAFLRHDIKTDPEYLAHYIDARNTLMFLSLFDKTVPIHYGRKLRTQIGRPLTNFLVADHRTSILYTQFVPLVPPNRCFAIFPFDYIESESLAFFNRSFATGRFSFKHLLYRVLQLPFEAAEWTVRKLF